MVIQKTLKVSRDEMLHYLFGETNIILAILSSIVAALSGMFITLGFLHFAGFFTIQPDQLITLSIVFIGLGIAIYFTKKEEFHLYDKTGSHIFIAGVFSYPIYIILFTLVLLYFFLPDWTSAQKGIQVNVVAAIILIFLISVAFSYLFNGWWKLISYFLLRLFARRDWVILAERDAFLSGLGLRFEESKRYGTALSLLNLTVTLPPREKKLLAGIYKRIANGVRDIDLISHFDNVNNFAVLAPITQAAGHGLFKRVVKLVQEELYTKGYKNKVMVEAGIATILPETESEFELLKPAEMLKEEIQI
jgi:hypothetical protein